MLHCGGTRFFGTENCQATSRGGIGSIGAGSRGGLWLATRFVYPGAIHSAASLATRTEPLTNAGCSRDGSSLGADRDSRANTYSNRQNAKSAIATDRSNLDERRRLSRCGQRVNPSGASTRPPGPRQATASQRQRRQSAGAARPRPRGCQLPVGLRCGGRHSIGDTSTGVCASQ